MKCAICLESDNGYQTVTVDTDGSPAFAGAILYGKYQSYKKVERLLKLGDLFELHEELNPVPNLGHYILKDGSMVQEVRLQEGVCISKHRDVRQIEAGRIKRKRPIKPRVYPNPKMACLCEGVDYVYVFNKGKEQWTTWGIDSKSKQFEKLKIHYMLYIKNLIYREDMSGLTETEKNNLKYVD